MSCGLIMFKCCQVIRRKRCMSSDGASHFIFKVLYFATFTSISGAKEVLFVE